jgi:hypothetical protein
MFAVGQKLVFTRPDGVTEPCEMLFKGCTPGHIVVTFFDANGRPTSHDGFTLPLNRLKKA